MMKRITIPSILLFTAILICGCNAFDSSWAYVGHVCCKNGDDYYNLGLTKQTRKLGAGRTGLNFFIECYDFKLAYKPEGRTVYSNKQITLTSADSFTENIPEFISGQIVVDMNRHLVYVSLKNQYGDFPGNGEYDLK
jgi:hypothetical protein